MARAERVILLEGGKFLLFFFFLSDAGGNIYYTSGSIVLRLVFAVSANYIYRFIIECVGPALFFQR